MNCPLAIVPTAAGATLLAPHPDRAGRHEGEGDGRVDRPLMARLVADMTR